MTKSELRRLIVECINEVIDEGAISSQDMADKVIGVIKDTVKSLNKQINDINNRYRGYGIRLEHIKFVTDTLNKEIDEKLVKTKIIPCSIKFSELEGSSAGVFNHRNKDIKLNITYLIIPRSIGLELRDFKNMNFGAMYSTIEHELIHQQQDERSKGKISKFNKGIYYLVKKYDSNGDGFLDPEDVMRITPKDRKIAGKILKKYRNKKFKAIFDKRKFIDPKLNDKDFLENVEYYNNHQELNTSAKDVVNSYVSSQYKGMKVTIKWGNLENREYSSDEVRNFILSPFLNPSDDMFKLQKTNLNRIEWVKRNLKSRFKQRIIDYHKGYKYLTAENKKKWWKYVFLLLLNYNFSPIKLG